MTPFISVIVPAHNEEQYIELSLQSLLNQTYGKENYEILVVDNNSSDATPTIVKSSANVRYLFKERGPVGAVRNYGVKHAQGEYLAFLDADCLAPKDWLSRGIAYLVSNEAGAAGGKSETHEQANWIEKYWLLGHKQVASESLGLAGCSIFISRENFHLVGGFDETVTSGEDTKLGDDLKRKGLTVKIVQELNVIHLGNAKTARTFIKRQSWHAENYFKDLARSAKDPVFLLTSLFLITSLATLPLLLLNSAAAFFSSAFALILPNILTLKRITRSPNPSRNYRHYHKIYALDLLYLVGRSLGTLKGFLQCLTLSRRPQQGGR